MNIEDIYIRVEVPEKKYSFGIEIKQIRLDPCRVNNNIWFKVFDINGVRKESDQGLQNQ